MDSTITALNRFTTVTLLVFAALSAGGTASAALDLTTPLNFVPITPCRIADTRTATGAFGGPSIAGQSSRDFVIPSSSCGIPTTAQAYSLNVAVVPQGPLGYLTVWPAGQTQPLVSTLNSDGRIKSNAAIVPAGTNGAISVFASNQTDVVLDIGGYFVPATTASALAFYPIAPCRIADTRPANGPLAGPYLTGQIPRTFPIQSSSCGLPAAAQAYSLNFAAVPHGQLGYLTAWPTGQPQPYVAALNAPTGAITSNAAIIPAGTAGSVDIFASNDTDLVIDVNGYFAPAGTGGLSMYNLQPCRVLDSRNPSGALPFSGATNVNIGASACAPAPSAQAYVLNATVVPPAELGYLTLWPQGSTQPLVSTLNSPDAAITGNMAIMPSTNGSISVFASNPTYLVLDISANFAPPPTTQTTTTLISDFNPKSGPIGTLVTLTGANLGTPQITMPQLSGGTISVPLSTATATSVTFVIPTGAATGLLNITTTTGTASSAVPFTVTPSSSFTLSAAPASASLIQGQSVSVAVTLNSTNAFSQLAPLAVGSLPTGVTAAFKPSSIAAGQTSILTLTAPVNQTIGTANLSVSAAAAVDGISLIQAAPVSLAVVAPTTTFLGRSVVADPLETPLAGVTVNMLGLDGAGNATGCTGNTMSDGAGNFALTNLPASCIGPQLVGFGGNSVTSPPGKYAGVNLVFTLLSGKVVVSPVLVHLPPINNAETFMVQQNATTDQTYAFTTIPGLTVTVYAGTTFTMADGTKPNPFPLAAVQVPVDRLPDIMPTTNAGVTPFIVAFQPANTTASQEVAVTYPNTLTTAPGTDMPLMTLNPTLGRMVPYGTGAVSADGSQIVPDIDPSSGTLNHRFGIVHFDWHGQEPPAPKNANPCPLCYVLSALFGAPASATNPSTTSGGPPTAGDPVDLSSGLQVLNTTDLSIQGTRGSIAIQRTYRTLSTYDGAFGPGHDLTYAWQLDTGSPTSKAAINIVRPDGNYLLFSRKSDGTLANSTIPWLQGVVMTTAANGNTSLRYPDGTVYQFQPFAGISYLSSITDRNGNAITLTVAPLNRSSVRITKVTDPVGRSLNLTYDANTHLVSVTDPIGRTVTYTYNATGTLATMTDPNGGVTKYQYDSQNRMSGMIDPRGVTMFQDTFNSSGRVAQQTRPDGGVLKFTYTAVNPLIDLAVAASPLTSTTVTDALGNQTTYRFNTQGIPIGVTDALGQTKSFTLSPGTNLVTQRSGPAQCPICGPPGQGTVTLTYDGNGNVLTSTDALGNTTTLTYEPTFNQVTSVTDPLNYKSTFAYDASGNLASATDQNGNTSKYSYGSNGLLVTATDPLANVTTVAYDNSANPVSVTDALGNVTKNSFDNVSRPVSTTDPLGRISKVNFDVLDRVVSVRDGRGSTTQFAYDPAGNLLTVTDPKGNATAFAYDTLNRVKTRTSPLGKSESYGYDLNGNTVQYTDRRGQVGTYQYDALNRLTTESYQDGATVTRAYDPYSRLTTVNDSVSGAFAFGYDLNGILVSESAPTGSIAYTRDQLQRVNTRKVAGQSAVVYTYDPAGNMLGATMPAAGITYSYDARNRPKALSRTNGVISSYTLDSLGRVLSLIHSKAGIAVNTQSYAYDPAGNRSGATNDMSQPLITQAAASTVDQANELLATGQTTFTNDLNGNRLIETNSNGSTSYKWDSRNRLSSITDAKGNSTSFKYDFRRNLIEMDKTFNGSSTIQTFVIDSLANIVSLTGGASGLPMSVLTGTSLDSHYASIDAANNVAFGITDIINNSVAVIGSGGLVTSRLDYEPYGQITGSVSSVYPFGFTGRVPAVGNIDYFRNRFYDSAAGRFLSEDPIGSTGASSSYRYANNNPVSFTDPTGLESVPYTEHPVTTTFGDCFHNCRSKYSFDVVSTPADVAGTVGILGTAASAGARAAARAVPEVCVAVGALAAGFGTATAAGCIIACSFPQDRFLYDSPQQSSPQSPPASQSSQSSGKCVTVINGNTRTIQCFAN